jgi:hypothetical protein
MMKAYTVRPPENEPARAPGLKLDGGKPRLWFGVVASFPKALRAVAEVTVQGVSEPGHTPHGWKTVEKGYVRYTEAMLRHLWEEAIAEVDDDHVRMAAVTAWNALARLEHLINERGPEKGDPIIEE